MNELYVDIAILILIYFAGFIVGRLTHTCKESTFLPIHTPVATSFKDAYMYGQEVRARTVKRPSAEKLTEKKKPQRLKDTEQAMEDTLDKIL